MNTYQVKSTKKVIAGKTVYYVIEKRNPHVSQHSGYYSKKSLAIAAMKKLQWGETPVSGDVHE